ncbi:MAG: hypothetical protein EBS54_09730 [Betaproteobacteria bacterium]|nr:hypothetical protein [Betaproteobacteria bacterium]
MSEIESDKRDPRLSSIERMAEAMGMTVLIVPETMAPELRRTIARICKSGRTYTTKPFNTQALTGQPSATADKPTAAPEYTGPEHAPQKA